MKIGYARVSTNDQDLTAQGTALLALGVDIADEVASKGVVLSLRGNSHDPTAPVVRLLFNVLRMVAEFEANLIWMRTCAGMGVAN